MLSNKLRKIAAVSVLALMSTGFAACSSSNDGGSAAPEQLKPGEVAKFTWYHRIPDKKGNTTLKELVDQFNKENPDIEVVPERMQGSAGESYAKINSMVEAGKDVPCVTQIGFERVPDMMGAMMDVKQYAEKYKDDFIPDLYNKATVGDKVFGFPQGASPILFFYRADLFEQYGLKVPTTWDEYKETAKLVREKSGNKSYLGAFLQDEIQWQAALTSSEGADWFGYDPAASTWSVNIKTPETEKVATYWQGLVDEKLVVPTTRWGQDFGKYLQDGTILSTIGGSWEAPLIADTAPDGNGKWKVAQIPHFDASNTTVGQNGGTIAAVLKGCKYPEQAVKFAHWWATNIKGLAGLGLLPAAKVDKIETPANLKEYFGGQEIYEEFIKANNNAPKVTWAPQIGKTLDAMSNELKLVGTTGSLPKVYEIGQTTAVDSLKAVGITVK
ncbi:hypothetical protein BSR29_00940 [Boudabousia liubingyangii]|uniref:ABC transporter substrate-binding protein n=1 Tax=Boudabousia liubingyangii TaxID=1921764 RepID=A0A1Q5PQ82_9ACTO|nr:extracellular solute-binding protein [Boudabousia liubingyangii]OKL48419.1 hypothetical protein BSR28_01580 [Boudabousia liubingyangii]OKL49555.1 hypothetical protein BSR29_00940 [Boudabousia liubingyangii]